MTVTMEWKVHTNTLPQIIQNMPLLADQITTKAALDIEAQAKTLAPVDTGLLRASIMAVRLGKAHWKVIVAAHYGMYVEWGTVHAPAQPFFRPAIETVRPQFLAALRRITA